MKRPSSHRLPFGLSPLECVLVLAGLLVIVAVACGLVTGGIPGNSNRQACMTSGQCVQLGACYEQTTCDENGFCTKIPVPDGTVPSGADQIPGDCQQLACKVTDADAGTAAVTSSVDDTDILPSSDSCIVNACHQGTPVMHASNQPDGTACMISGVSGDGMCSGGKCIITCTSDSDCSSTNLCVVSASCVQGQCNIVLVPDNDPPSAYAQSPGDCRKEVCIGGTDTNVADNGNTPLPQGACFVGTCVNGVPQQQVNAGASCTGGTCDSGGNCVPTSSSSSSSSGITTTTTTTTSSTTTTTTTTSGPQGSCGGNPFATQNKYWACAEFTTAQVAAGEYPGLIFGKGVITGDLTSALPVPGCFSLVMSGPGADLTVVCPLAGLQNGDTVCFGPMWWTGIDTTSNPPSVTGTAQYLCDPESAGMNGKCLSPIKIVKPDGTDQLVPYSPPTGAGGYTPPSPWTMPVPASPNAQYPQPCTPLL